MPKASRDQSAVLVVMVGPTAGGRPSPASRAERHTTQIALVRAILSEASGEPQDAGPEVVVRRFGHWSAAVDAAVALRARLRVLSAEIGGIDARMALSTHVADEPDGVLLRRLIRIASRAGRDAIWLAKDLAGTVREQPPDRMAVRALGGKQTGEPGVHELVPASDSVPTNLVDASTRFVGRERDISAVCRLLAQDRMVTISGPPGIGKSRLAEEVAARVLGRFEAGAWLISLAPLTDPDLVAPSMATTIGAPAAPGVPPIDAIAAFVGHRRMLLVLDNFEHLTRAALDVSSLLDAVPRLSLIVTSQSHLAIAGEVEYVLAPLDLPSAAAVRAEPSTSAAVDLFLDRAMAAAPGFRADPGTLELVTDVCRHLDGLPLAIELAAARTKVMSVGGIRDRLDHRMALLAGGPSDQPVRHQSLSAAIAWSYDLLRPSGQRLFQRLSIFRGGWTVDGAIAIADPSAAVDTLDDLSLLVDASLVVKRDTPARGSRFDMLESLREFGVERLEEGGEFGPVQDLYTNHLLALANRLGPELTGREQAAALDELAADHDNIRAALAGLLESDPVRALRLGSAIWRFWQMRGHLDEGSSWMDRALGVAAHASDDDLAPAHTAAGGLAYWRGDLLATERHYEEVVRVRRSLGDDVTVADALFDLAFVFDPSLRPPPEDQDRTTAGIRIAQESHDRYVSAGHEPGIAKSEWLLGSIMARRDLDGAQALLKSSVERFRSIGDLFGLAWALHSYGLVALRNGEPEGARIAFGEALGLFAAAGDGSATALLLEDFAEVSKVGGDSVRTARLRGAASGMRQETHAELVVANAPWLFEDGDRRGLVDEAAVQQAWREGRALSQADAIAFALGTDVAAVAERGLRIRALGPLLVERDGERVSDWGGPKAGNRHALAIFAFLLDRGSRGVTKDEFVEVLWPDAEVHQGDLNLHRTLSGLRSMLEQAGGSSVVFAGGRYRLAGSLVSWLDETEFHERLLHASQATDDLLAIRALEAARSLYRGDYLDDCPLYGDSEYVEVHRRRLRGLYIDALVDLAQRYEARRDDSLASARFREAITVSGGDCPSAQAGLERLGVTA